jgi:hypothetical protein
MKSESRVKGYKPGTEEWKAEYNMLLEDGLTCNNCTHVKKCCSIFGQTPYVNEGKCQFYPNRFFITRLYRIEPETISISTMEGESHGKNESHITSVP